MCPCRRAGQVDRPPKTPPLGSGSMPPCRPPTRVRKEPQGPKPPHDQQKKFRRKRELGGKVAQLVSASTNGPDKTKLSFICMCIQACISALEPGNELPALLSDTAPPTESVLSDAPGLTDEETWWADQASRPTGPTLFATSFGDATYHDPPPPQQLLFVPVVVGTTPVRAPVDSGASDSFIDEELVLRLGVRMYSLRQPLAVKVANGQTLPVTKFVRLKVEIGNMHTRLSLRVITTPLSLVLGYPFLSKFAPKRLKEPRK